MRMSKCKQSLERGVEDLVALTIARLGVEVCLGVTHGTAR